MISGVRFSSAALPIADVRQQPFIGFSAIGFGSAVGLSTSSAAENKLDDQERAVLAYVGEHHASWQWQIVKGLEKDSAFTQADAREADVARGPAKGGSVQNLLAAWHIKATIEQLVKQGLIERTFPGIGGFVLTPTGQQHFNS